MTNVERVQAIYAAFGRGDVSAILAMLAEPLEWVNPGEGAPYGGARTNIAQVREFFSTLAATVEVQSFEPRQFVADGEEVVVLGAWRATVKATGKTFSSDWAMHWRFQDGKVVYFRAYEDTGAVAAAFSSR